MSDLTTITQNTEYAIAVPEMQQIRDVIEGSPCIKRAGPKYLEHPATKDDDGGVRYREILQNAEFDEFTSVTESVLLGKMSLNDINFEPPKTMPYMLQDVDNDGLSMRGLAETCIRETLQVKFLVLLTEFNGVGTLAIEDDGKALSKNDIKAANERPTIKQYTRESLIDWDFDRINGVMQFNYLLLHQNETSVDPETGSREIIDSYIKLALDEDGNYYQQKRSDAVNGCGEYGPRNYVIVGKEHLKYIPVNIATDSEFMPGQLPRKMGFLGAIGELALQRYRMSAKYKEALGFTASLHVFVDGKDVWPDFEEINKRPYLASGPSTPNVWPCSPTEADIKIVEPAGDLTRFATYFEDNKNKVKAMGGSFKTNATVQRTATEIMEEASTIISILHPIADNTESAIKWQLANCAVMNGDIKQTDRAKYIETIDLTLPREFALSKLSVEEVKALLDVYTMSLLPKEEFISLLVMGGWTISNAEDLLTKLESNVL